MSSVITKIPQLKHDGFWRFCYGRYQRYNICMKHLSREYLKSIVFGLEDSLVSTTGLIAGMSVGADNKEAVLLAGLVAISIEALSMGAGEFLSDEAMHEIDKLKRHADSPVISGLLMFVSYLSAGLIPLTPVILFDYPQSIYLSIAAALSALFLIGYIKGKIVHTSSLASGMKILVVGGAATLVGVAVGMIFRF